MEQKELTVEELEKNPKWKEAFDEIGITAEKYLKFHREDDKKEEKISKNCYENFSVFLLDKFYSVGLKKNEIRKLCSLIYNKCKGENNEKS